MTDYETTCRTFRLHVPDDYEFTRDVVEHWAAQHPGKLALVARTGGRSASATSHAPRVASPTRSRASASPPASGRS